MSPRNLRIARASDGATPHIAPRTVEARERHECHRARARESARRSHARGERVAERTTTREDDKDARDGREARRRGRRWVVLEGGKARGEGGSVAWTDRDDVAGGRGEEEDDDGRLEGGVVRTTAEHREHELGAVERKVRQDGRHGGFMARRRFQYRQSQGGSVRCGLLGEY